MQAAQCIGNMNGVAKKHLISLHIDCEEDQGIRLLLNKSAPD